MPRLSVTAAEFQKGFGRYREAALKEPVTITNHGRDSLVLMAGDEYRRLKRRECLVMGLEDFTDADLAAIEGQLGAA
ncbi:MAG TPA: type II toxin-antitoxin system prevent-host-death family antitoxin [Caulobacteraceae bacterium]|nr:type II toxin-antitoxin system prevent-host-death family antitoxin [Caulobacteraceae bacterium]